jgi:hypothetical protein
MIAIMEPPDDRGYGATPPSIQSSKSAKKSGLEQS